MEEKINYNEDQGSEYRETIKPIYKWLFTIIFVPLCLIIIKPYIVGQIDLRGQSYMEYNEFNESVREYKKIALLDKNNVIAKNWLAYSYWMTKDNDNAAKIYSQVIATDPNDKRALLNLGLILALDGKIREAIPHFEKLRQLGDTNILNTLVTCYERIGELDKAKNLKAEMLKQNPKSKNAQIK